MRALVVYESIYGNTRDVADAIGAGLRTLPDAAVDLVEVGAAPASGEGYDIVVVGGPVHAWRMTSDMTREGARDDARKAGKAPVSTGRGVREWLQSLAPAVDLQAAAAFDTVMRSKWFPMGSAAKGEAAALRRAGFQLLAEPEHFRVGDTQGPLLPGELDRAGEWGAALVQEWATTLARS